MQAFFGLVPHVDKNFTFEQFCKMMPLPGDEQPKKATKKVMTREMADQIRAAHNNHVLDVRKGNK